MWRTTRNFSKTYAETVSAFLASRQRNEKDSIAQRPLSPGPTLAGDTWMRRKKPSCSGDKMYSVCQYLSVYARQGYLCPGRDNRPPTPLLGHPDSHMREKDSGLCSCPVGDEGLRFPWHCVCGARKKMCSAIHRFTCHPCSPLRLGQTWIWGKCWSQTSRFATLEISLFPWHSRSTAHQGTQKAPEIYFCT